MIFKQIREAAILRIQTLLPSYSILTNQLKLEDNSDRLLNKGFAVVWGSTTMVDGPLRKFSANATLSVYLTFLVEGRSSDDVAPTIDAYYSDAETLIRSFLNNTYLGISTVIRGLNKANVATPYLISNDRYGVLKIDFTVDFTMTIID